MAEHSEAVVPQANGSVPIFLRNTHDMISFCDRSNPSVATWDSNGTNIVIKDTEALARDIFPAYFKHTNFLSFARQLNFYGFRKVKSRMYCVYHHECFLRNRADLLSLIRRQPSDANYDHQIVVPASSPLPPAPTNTDEVEDVKKKVDTLTATVASLHKEVTDLKSIVTSLVDVIQSNSSIIYELQAARSAHAGKTSDDTRKRYYETRNEDDVRKPIAFAAASPNHATFRTDSTYTDSMYENQGYRIQQDSSSYIGEHTVKRPKMIHEVSFSYPSVGSAESCHAATMIGQKTVHEDSSAHHSQHWAAHAAESRGEARQPLRDCPWGSRSPELRGETRQPQPDQHWKTPPREAKCETHQPQQDRHWGAPSVEVRAENLQPQPDTRWGTPPAEARSENQNVVNSSNNVESSVAAAAPSHDYECTVDSEYGFEDMAWFALFEEDVSHSTDDQIFAPQA